ncbi:MAG: nucleotidyltransferase family protein [Deltaproteobacteria bacterium]|nr:nucleotidyltransferase family protein [Deltaproteobacteria bacterium]
MGQQKLLLDLRGKPVLRWVLEAALGSELDEVICVVREPKEIQERIFLGHDKLRWVTNEKAKEGQSTSVIAGLRAINAKSDAALFLVGDQPLVKTDLINGLIGLFKKSRSLIVAPTFRGQTRNPVLFQKDLFPELLELTGDRGGRGLIEKYRGEVAALDWNEEMPFLDMDKWDDYEKLKRLC